MTTKPTCISAIIVCMTCGTFICLTPSFSKGSKSSRVYSMVVNFDIHVAGVHLKTIGKESLVPQYRKLVSHAANLLKERNTTGTEFLSDGVNKSTTQVDGWDSHYFISLARQDVLQRERR